MDRAFPLHPFSPFGALLESIKLHPQYIDDLLIPVYHAVSGVSYHLVCNSLKQFKLFNALAMSILGGPTIQSQAP